MGPCGSQEDCIPTRWSETTPRLHGLYSLVSMAAPLLSFQGNLRDILPRHPFPKQRTKTLSQTPHNFLMALPPGVKNQCVLPILQVRPSGRVRTCSRSVSEEGTEPGLRPRGPGPPTPHCPESRLLGPVSRAGLTRSPHLPWLPAPGLSRSGPNCPKSLCQASVPTGPPFAMSPFPPLVFPQLPPLGAASSAFPPCRHQTLQGPSPALGHIIPGSSVATMSTNEM